MKKISPNWTNSSKITRNRDLDKKSFILWGFSSSFESDFNFPRIKKSFYKKSFHFSLSLHLIDFKEQGLTLFGFVTEKKWFSDGKSSLLLYFLSPPLLRIFDFFPLQVFSFFSHSNRCLPKQSCSRFFLFFIQFSKVGWELNRCFSNVSNRTRVAPLVGCIKTERGLRVDRKEMMKGNRERQLTPYSQKPFTRSIYRSRSRRRPTGCWKTFWPRCQVSVAPLTLLGEMTQLPQWRKLMVFSFKKEESLVD